MGLNKKSMYEKKDSRGGKTMKAEVTFCPDPLNNGRGIVVHSIKLHNMTTAEFSEALNIPPIDDSFYYTGDEE